MKFRLKVKDEQNNKAGDHYIGNKRYVGGDVLESPQPLDKVFRGKFERVPDETKVSTPEIVKVAPLLVDQPAAVVDTGAESPSSAPSGSDGTQGQDASQDTPLGKDITAQFKEAKLAGVRVFRTSKGGYVVADAESLEVLKKAKDEAVVNKHIKKLLG